MLIAVTIVAVLLGMFQAAPGATGLVAVSVASLWTSIKLESISSHWAAAILVGLSSLIAGVALWLAALIACAEVLLVR